ncbi:helix-turn-helix domain-containing protein [Alkalihalobacillus sp. LMS6]|uniref:helix-turn-helix domain-containing protein n=1 Tax=Alkalihalobacillus sp. LMS6 TaxID=2924034 RepID=UPI0020D11191|nr:helix-turn-helix transcriptional regulator [Alkalihalobacillus sp. LMS6]UTR05431.1 helix-turn-helix domain-containing protein [Alkalihalobacillus sp. LMS6]
MIKRLIELRKSHNLRQGDVAELLNVKQNTYSNYEQGTREMDYHMLLFLADYYKVSLDYIFERTENPIVNNVDFEDESELISNVLSTYRKIKNENNWR